jgi:hypothetical protein
LSIEELFAGADVKVPPTPEPSRKPVKWRRTSPNRGSWDCREKYNITVGAVHVLPLYVGLWKGENNYGIDWVKFRRMYKIPARIF